MALNDRSAAAIDVTIPGAGPADSRSRIACTSLTTRGARWADVVATSAILHVVIEIGAGAIRAGGKTRLTDDARPVLAHAADANIAASATVRWIVAQIHTLGSAFCETRRTSASPAFDGGILAVCEDAGPAASRGGR